jgi:hypothetical protein
MGISTMKARLAISILVVVCCVLPATAQKVFVDPAIQDHDYIGQRFAFALKEQLRKSASYKVVDAGDDKPLTIHLLTMSTSDNNVLSAISVLVVIPTEDGLTFVLDHRLLLVGRDRVDDMASTTMANLDKSLSELRAALQAGMPKNTPVAKQ